jgi:hypothetical protein
VSLCAPACRVLLFAQTEGWEDERTRGALFLLLFRSVRNGTVAQNGMIVPVPAGMVPVVPVKRQSLLL